MSRGIVTAPQILLPDPGHVDYGKWSVVACDQFTSEPDYWSRLNEYVGESASSLRLVYPEVYLDDRREERISAINRTMQEYRSSGVWTTLDRGLILVERMTPSGRRIGLVAAVDLEAYSYEPNGSPLIRATEGTVLSRIPPRVQIRRNATVELPHIMLLLDDRKKCVIEPLYERRGDLQKLYDFDLNMGGGHLRGYFVSDWEPVIARMEELLSPELLLEKYGTQEQILLAVGDGNHSLATAKACWEEIKEGLSEAERNVHPARFALCEIVNIHDEGIRFEPIHRAVFGVDPDDFISNLREALRDCRGSQTSCLLGDLEFRMPVSADTAETYGIVQKFLDEYCARCGCKVDYIHGEQSLRQICREKNCAGILMPALAKEDLFGYVLNHGPLPRKTFSMGEAVEKRYYLEAKLI